MLIITNSVSGFQQFGFLGAAMSRKLEEVKIDYEG